MTDPLFSVEDKVILITGGSRGLGRAMSLGLAERGAKVIVSSRKLDSCEELVAKITANGGEARALACHVADWDSLDDFVAQAQSFWGRIDGLVNNAGMSPIAPSLLETSEALVDKILGVNLKGPLRLTALAAKVMAENGGGAVVNISSLASLKPTPFVTTYAAAKAGLNAITTASAIEFAPVNVRVNGIVCGTFYTDASAGFTNDPEALAEITRVIAQNRVGNPEEVVGAVLYFLSAASTYTTGSLLTIDGGVV